MPPFVPIVMPLNVFVILSNDVITNRLDKNLCRLFGCTVAAVLALIFLNFAHKSDMHARLMCHCEMFLLLVLLSFMFSEFVLCSE